MIVFHPYQVQDDHIQTMQNKCLKEPQEHDFRLN
jgi:hypothetical protein